MHSLKTRPNTRTHLFSSDFDTFISDLTIAVWNHLEGATSTGPMAPREFARFYEALGQALHPYLRRLPSALKVLEVKKH